MFAVLRIGNKQYKVEEKDVILVDKIDGDVGNTVDFSDVLLIGGDKKISVGKPIVKGAKVTAKVLGQEKGDKIAVRRFKSKVRYRRHIGFRPSLTRLEITGISV